MASHAHPDPPAQAAGGIDKVALKKSLYEACTPFTASNPRMTFHQSDLLDLEIIPNDSAALLMEVAQALCNDKLFKIVMSGDGMGWKLRTVEEAKKYVPFPLLVQFTFTFRGYYRGIGIGLMCACTDIGL